MCVYAVLSSRPRTVYDNNTLYIEQLYIYYNTRVLHEMIFYMACEN